MGAGACGGFRYQALMLDAGLWFYGIDVSQYGANDRLEAAVVAATAVQKNSARAVVVYTHSVL